jgi:hypothetical protein
VATGASYVFWRVAQARVAVEAAPGAQAEEDLARAPLQSLLHLETGSYDGVVARIEDEQGKTVPPFPSPSRSSTRPSPGPTQVGATQGVIFRAVIQPNGGVELGVALWEREACQETEAF